MTLSTLRNLFRSPSFIFYLIWYLIDFKKTHMIFRQKNIPALKSRRKLLIQLKSQCGLEYHPLLKNTPPSFSPSPVLNLQTVQTPCLGNLPYILFLLVTPPPPPKIWIFQWIPIILIFLLNPASLLLKVIKLLKHAHILP